MPTDPDAITSFADWVPELELGDTARCLQNIYTYLSQLNNYLNSATPSSQLATRLEANSRALGQTITEMIGQIQRQDALDIGDPDINEEVVGTLRNVLTNISALCRSRSLNEATTEAAEAIEAIADLADYVASY